MAYPALSLSYVRGWRGAKWVKRATAKRARRLSREAIRVNDGEPTKAVIRGYAS